MKKKRSTRSTVNFADILVGIICLFGTVYCLFLFWKDINVSFQKNNEEPIAVIYFKKNTAQRKLLDGNIWERLRTASPIYNGDKIRTASMSEAYTIFDDCSKIDLHENTLIQVFSKKNKNSIEFISGSISVLSTQVDSASPMSIQTGNKILSFTENASAVISMSPVNVNQAIITVTSGSVNLEELPIQEPQTESLISQYLPNLQDFMPQVTTPLTTIDAGNCVIYEPLTLSQDLTAAAKSVVANPSEVYKDFSVSMPTSSYSVTKVTGKSIYVPFFWANSKEIMVDFATDAGFENIIETKTLKSDSCRSSVSLDFAKDESAVFWRAIPLPLTIGDSQADNKKFPQGIIFINTSEEVKMLKPMAQVFGDKDAEKMEKSISENELNSNNIILGIIEKENIVEVEEPVVEPESIIEEKPVEPEVIKEEPVKPVEKQAEKPAEKPAVAKPAPKPAEKPAAKPAEKPAAKPAEKPAPKPAEKPVDKTPAFVSEAPSLTSPAKGIQYTEDDFLVENAKIDFTWKAVKEAQSYKFVIEDPSGKAILTKTVTDAIFTLKDDGFAILDNGTFKWKVTAQATIDGKTYSSKTAESTFAISISDIETAVVDTENLIQ